jgi:hypothetical protein
MTAGRPKGAQNKGQSKSNLSSQLARLQMEIKVKNRRIEELEAENKRINSLLRHQISSSASFSSSSSLLPSNVPSKRATNSNSNSNTDEDEDEYGSDMEKDIDFVQLDEIEAFARIAVNTASNSKSTSSSSISNNSDNNNSNNNTNINVNNLNNSVSEESRRHLQSISINVRYQEDIIDDDEGEVENQSNNVEEEELEVEENDLKNTTYTVKDSSVMGKYIREIVAKLNSEIKSLGTIKLYRESKSFWIYQENPYLSRYCSKGLKVDSDIAYIRDLFVWAPHLLHTNNRIPCPLCKEPLSNDGWAHNPCARYVVDINNNFFILSYNYKCKSCNKSLLGSCNEIVNNLQPHLASQFPAVFTWRGSFSKNLVKLIQPCFYNGLGPTAFSKMLWELHTHSYDEAHVDWLYHILSLFDPKRIIRPRQSMIKPFSSFLDTDKWNDHIPSASTIRDIFIDTISPLKDCVEKKMGMYSAEIMRSDLSFKV